MLWRGFRVHSEKQILIFWTISNLNLKVRLYCLPLHAHGVQCIALAGCKCAALVSCSSAVFVLSHWIGFESTTSSCQFIDTWILSTCIFTRPAARQYFHQVSSHDSAWVRDTSPTAPTLLLLPFSSITFNHIPLHPIADPVKLGATFLFVLAEMSAMFCCGCIITLRDPCAGTHSSLFESIFKSVSQSLYLFFSSLYWPAAVRGWPTHFAALKQWQMLPGHRI